MRHLDLFSGIGGFSLALERQGFRTVAFSEIDSFACKVLAHHWSHVPNLGAIENIQGCNVWADIVTAGFPCQDLSVAGKRVGLKGARSGLYWQIIRIVREMQEAGHGPTLIVLENVPGLFSSHGGRDFASVLRGLAELRPLDIAWRVLDAQFFGVPQRRRRIFLVADFGGERAAEILSLSESVQGDSAQGGTPRQDVACALGRSFGDRSGDLDAPMVTHSLNAHGVRMDGESETFVTHIPILEATSRQGLSNEGSVGIGQHGDPMFTLSSTQQHGVASFHENQRAETTLSSTTALNAGGGKPGQGYPAIQGSFGVRRLLPIEAERLQGFPDNWTRLTLTTADGPRYRALGNAVAVPVVEWLAQRIMHVLQRDVPQSMSA